MRNFDLLQNFVDDKGQPLHGKIMFTERGALGSSYPSLKPIYNSVGNEISNPVFTDNLGKTETQVFLDNGEYSVWLFKYVGGGNMSTDTDSDHWQLVDSLEVVDIYNDIEIELDATKVRGVDSIAALRSINPATIPGEKKVVAVKGYTTAGDKRVVFYKSSTSGSDNGGSVIQSSYNSSVYWVLVDGSKAVDVRDFGVFPNKGDDTNVGQISAAVSYATANGKDVYFPAGDYKLNGGNIAIVGGLVLDAKTTFTAKNGTTTNISCKAIEGVPQAQFLQSEDSGVIVLTAPILKQSYTSGNCRVSATDTLIVDRDDAIDSTKFGSPAKCQVVVNSTKAIAFKNCLVECLGTLSKTASYSYTNCRLDPANFLDVVDYFRACTLGGLNIIDFGGKYCAELKLEVNGSYNATLKNGVFGKLTLKNTADDETDNCTVTIDGCIVGQLGGDFYWKNLNITNSTVTPGTSRDDDKANMAGIMAQNISVTNSKVYANASSGSFGTSGCKCPEINIENSDIYGMITAKKVFISNSTIRQKVSVATMYEDDSIAFNINGCEFIYNGCISINGMSASSVNFVCVNNTFNGASNGFAYQNIDDNNLDGYVYEGNVGNCIQKEYSISFETDNGLAGATADMEALTYFKIGSSRVLPILGFGQRRVQITLKYLSCCKFNLEKQFFDMESSFAYTCNNCAQNTLSVNSSGRAVDAGGNEIVSPTYNLIGIGPSLPNLTGVMTITAKLLG